MHADGSPSITILDWLALHMLEAPRTRGPPSAAASVSSFADAQKRLSNLRRDGPDGGGGKAGGGGGGRPNLGNKMHRPGCMCVVCKQMRAAGQLPGIEGLAASGGGEALGITLTGVVSAATGGGGGGGGGTEAAALLRRVPQLRYGKRAYVQAMPHLVSGVRRHK